MQPRETRIGIPSDEILPANPIKRWAERGFNNESVAVYGTSSELVQQIVSTGIIPSVSHSDHLLPYQRRLVGKSGHLYFFFPVIEHVKQINSAFMEQYYPLFEGWSRGEVNEEMEFPRLKSSAESYAAWTSLEHVVKHSTGISAYFRSILAVSYDLLPQETAEKIGAEIWGDEEDSRENSDPQEVAELLSFPNRKQLVQTLREGLERRGVLIYCNSGIFPNRVLPGFEDEHELLIVSAQPLKTDVISGIEVLSEADRKVLGLK